MMDWAMAWVQKLGGHAEKRDIGNQTLENGNTIPLPPILLAVFGNDPTKKTVRTYIYFVNRNFYS
jgi:hypothetical protein